MYVAKLPGRQLLDPAAFDSGDGASQTHAWWSGSGNDFNCTPTGGAQPGPLDPRAGRPRRPGRDGDAQLQVAAGTSSGTTTTASCMTTTDGGKTYTSHASDERLHDVEHRPARRQPEPATPARTTYGNGLTGTSGSYAAGTEAVDRKLEATYPEAVFLADSYDISDLAGEAQRRAAVQLRHRPGPGPSRLVHRRRQGHRRPDARRAAARGHARHRLRDQRRTRRPAGLQRRLPGGPDHRPAVHPGLEVPRGRGGVDPGPRLLPRDARPLRLRPRGPRPDRPRPDRASTPGFYLAYTDEAHGYGNAGTDDPPAQSPLDSVPRARATRTPEPQRRRVHRRRPPARRTPTAGDGRTSTTTPTRSSGRRATGSSATTAWASTSPR